MKKMDLSGGWAFLLEEGRDLDRICSEEYGAELVIPKEYAGEMILPGSVSWAKVGKENEAREAGFLTDAYKFEGFCWYQRTVELPQESGEAFGQQYLLRLERTRISHVWIDGEYVGMRDSLVSAHEYDLTGKVHSLRPVITILVSNVGYPAAGGHLTSPDTQTNWIGILGEISLTICEGAFLHQVSGFYHSESNSLELRLKAFGAEALQGKLKVSFDLCRLKQEYLETESDCSIWEEKALRAPAETTDEETLERYLEIVREALPSVTVPVSLEKGRGVASVSLPEDIALWDEEDPYVYRLTCEMTEEATGEVLGLPARTWCGLHSFVAAGDHFENNGEAVFLRGRHQGMLFPLSGFAPMNVEGWLRDFKIAKDWGINHERFHSCCPPEAAFLAADLLGIYLQPEIPFWGNWYGEGDEEYAGVATAQSFLTREGFRMLEAYAGHASYVMMTMGNELWGNPDAINALELGFKAKYPHVLFSMGSNAFQFAPRIVEGDDFFSGVRFSRDRLFRGSYAQCDAPLGHVQTMKPGTTYDYDQNIRPTYPTATEAASGDVTIEIQYGTGVKKVKLTEVSQELIPEIPVVSHEIGQYCVYPDYREIPRYTGVCKPRNLELFRERLEKAGMAHKAEDFFRCSGKLAMDCYKAELETAMRSKYLAGYQILDLQDFSGQGTALVGPLNALMENKGILEPEQWRCFCSDAVLLARFQDYVLEAGQDFTFEVEFANYRKAALQEPVLVAQLVERESETILWESSVEITDAIDRGRNALGQFTCRIPEFDQAQGLVLVVALAVVKEASEGPVFDTSIYNEYELVVYPKANEVKAVDNVHICKSGREAVVAALSHPGDRVLLLLAPEENPKSVQGAYCTDFWCYPMFRSISESVGRPVPVGTLGLCIDKEHPALAGFASEAWSTPQWFTIVEHSRSTILDESGIEPVVWTIDNIERNHKLGLLYELEIPECGSRILVCGADLEGLSAEGCLEAAALLRSLTDYLAGELTDERELMTADRFLSLFS